MSYLHTWSFRRFRRTLTKLRQLARFHRFHNPSIYMHASELTTCALEYGRLYLNFSCGLRRMAASTRKAISGKLLSLVITQVHGMTKKILFKWSSFKVEDKMFSQISCSVFSGFKCPAILYCGRNRGSFISKAIILRAYTPSS